MAQALALASARLGQDWVLAPAPVRALTVAPGLTPRGLAQDVILALGVAPALAVAPASACLETRPMALVVEQPTLGLALVLGLPPGLYLVRFCGPPVPDV